MHWNLFLNECYIRDCPLSEEHKEFRLIPSSVLKYYYFYSVTISILGFLYSVLFLYNISEKLDLSPSPDENVGKLPIQLCP